MFEKYIQQFNLPWGKKLKGFSSGMKMKLSITVALAHHPKLLILEVDTSGLDPVVLSEILDMLFEFYTG